MDDKFYRILKHKSNEFELDSAGGRMTVRARGRLKRAGELLVGDFVRVDHSAGEPVISEVMPRRNFLVRPAVANVDIAVIVVAPQPEIDYYLIDKMIINCKRVGIECAICLNKSDLADGELEILDAQFSKDVAAVVSVSALSGDIGNLLPLLKDKLVCFAGQSAVGKSTISNGILGGAVRAVGSLSDRIGRGRNTTTSAEILKSDKGFSFIDTPGFSMLDLFEEDYGSLAAYYDEYFALSDCCRFHPCTHTAEPGCAVRAAAESGMLNRDRYDRYVRLYEECKNASKTRRRNR